VVKAPATKPRVSISVRCMAAVAREFGDEHFTGFVVIPRPTV
jgi:hypothetical protein